MEAGRLDPAGDRPEGPARDAAPAGALLRADRERRAARHAARRQARRAARRHAAGPVVLQASRPSLPATSASTRRRSTSSGTASTRPRTARARRRRCSGTSPSRSRARRGRRRRSVRSARLVARRPGRPVVVVRLRADRGPELVVCAVIENGGHGGTAAAPAALACSEQFFHVRPSASVPPAGGLIGLVEYVTPDQHRAAARRALRGRRFPPPGSRLAAPRRGCRARRHRPLGDRRGSRATTSTADPDYYLVRQGVFALLGAIGSWWSRSSSTPSSTAPQVVAIYGVMTGRAPGLSSSWSARRRGARAAGSTSASSASSPPSSGSCSSSSSWPRSSPTAPKLDEWRTTRAAVGLGPRPDPARLPPARHRHRPRLRGGAPPPRSSSPARAGAPGGAGGGGALAADRRPVVPARGRDRRAQAVPAGAPDVVPRPWTRPERHVVQPPPVEDLGRLGRARPAAESAARRRRTTSTSPSTRPTSPSPRSPSSAGSPAALCCWVSTCWSSGEGSAS